MCLPARVGERKGDIVESDRQAALAWRVLFVPVCSARIENCLMKKGGTSLRGLGGDFRCRKFD